MPTPAPQAPESPLQSSLPSVDRVVISWARAVAGIVASALLAAVVTGVPVTSVASADVLPASSSFATTAVATSVVETALDAAAASQRRAEVAEALLDGIAGTFAVSVLDVETGEVFTHGSGTYDTASIVKVDILAALLLQAQDADRELTSTERSLASVMIRESDNEATDVLYSVIGGASGLATANRRLGLTETTPHQSWGVTQTTTQDQVRLVSAVLGTDSPLTEASQDYVRGLMESVLPSQNFGVTAAADDPAASAVKVGFLERTVTGRWDVTSIGEIEVGGRTYVAAVLSEDNASFAGGATLVDAVARAAMTRFATA